MGDLFPPGGKWFDLEQSRHCDAETYREVLGHHEPFGSADLTILGDHEVSCRVYAPFRELRETWEEFGVRPIPMKEASLLCAEFIIPQMEVKLVGRSNAVKYASMRWARVRDGWDRDQEEWGKQSL